MIVLADCELIPFVCLDYYWYIKWFRYCVSLCSNFFGSSAWMVWYAFVFSVLKILTTFHACFQNWNKLLNWNNESSCYLQVISSFGEVLAHHLLIVSRENNCFFCSHGKFFSIHGVPSLSSFPWVGVTQLSIQGSWIEKSAA